MILYRLICERDHEFEAWFRNSASCDEQLEKALVSCPFCDTTRVSKALMTPNVVSSRARDARQERAVERQGPPENRGETGVATPRGPAAGPTPGALEQRMVDLAKVINAVRTQVEASCENVGDRFASEARMIHYGETEARPIYGQATSAEASELASEGIVFSVLPWTSGTRN